MKAELKTITPAWAAKILAEKNTGNRPTSQSHVKQLAREITQGKWKVNGDTICLNGSRLIDGQHRLKAIVMAGIPITSFVIEGLPSDVFDTKDVGKRRSPADTLAVRGEVNTTRLAAALVMIDQYCTSRADRKISYTNSELEELLEKYPTVRESLKNKTGKGLLPPAVLNACHYIFAMKDPALAEEFIEKTTKGIGLEDGCPWLALRSRLVGNTVAKAKLSKWHLMALCIKAFNAARAGRKVYQLKWNNEGQKPEPFPVAQ